MSAANANKAAPKARKGRAAAIGLGLTAASMLAAQSADAATEVATLAAGDGRPGLFLALFAPALIWVGINIAGPALNQLNAMSDKKPAAGGGKKGGRR
jgi:photosystem II PsbY protein